MSTKQTAAHLKHKDGELSVAQNVTDTPLLPVDDFERLNTFKPAAIDWVLEETSSEADHRRRETHRVNTFVFIERIIGQIFAFLIGISGVVGGACVATRGQPWAGVSISTAALTGLAVVFIKGRSSK
ncbi:MAG: hypothetical protein WCY67_11675 [Acidithiobacillus sp.]